MLTQQTVTHLRTLRLDGMARAFEEQLTQPVATGLAFEDRFGLLVDRELAWRDTRRLERLLKQAKLMYPRPASRISTPAAPAVSMRASSRASLVPTGFAPATACSSPVPPGSARPGSPARWAKPPVARALLWATPASAGCSKICASPTATAALGAACSNSPAPIS